MSQKRVYYYQVQAFGDPPTPGAPAQRISLHDVMTMIASLDPKKSDSSGRIYKCPPELDSEHLFFHILKNDPKERRIYGIIGEIRSKNLPDTFDWATGMMTAFSLKSDLLEKSFFLIDTSTGDMLFYQTKNSPSTGSMALYIQEKCKGFVRSFSPAIHFRKDALDKILDQDRRGKIKSFELKIKKTAVDRSDILGDSIEGALKSLAGFSNVDSIGITLSIGKGKKKGGFSLGGVMDGIKKFMGFETSDNPSSEIEQASFRLENEEVNLLNKKFGVYMYISDKIFQNRHVDPNSIFHYMEREYGKRLEELSNMGTKISYIDPAEEPKEDSPYDAAT